MNLTPPLQSSVLRSGQSGRVRLHEYRRPGWTFHGKGLWYYPDQQQSASSPRPAATMIGSPNFGHRCGLGYETGYMICMLFFHPRRSQHRDLEAQVTLVTSNFDLQTQLHQEQESLFQHSEQVKEDTFKEADRRVPYWVRTVVALWRNFF